MIDIELIRDRPEFVKESMEKVGADPDLVDRVRELDERWRELLSESQDLKATRNEESKKIGQMEEGDEREALIERMRDIGDKIDSLDEEAEELRDELDELMLSLPNIPHEEAPYGESEDENVVRQHWGDKPEFDFEPQPHWDLGEQLGILDFERGRKLSGSRFYVMQREGSLLQRALVNWMLDVHVTDHGYTEVYPPFLVRPHCLVGTGNLPKFDENLYRDEQSDLWLIPTAEVPLTNLHRDEILEADELPIHYTAYTACFRREKMHAGQDVRGIKRGHQFDKVELMKYVRPENSDEELTEVFLASDLACRSKCQDRPHYSYRTVKKARAEVREEN